MFQKTVVPQSKFVCTDTTELLLPVPPSIKDVGRHKNDQVLLFQVPIEDEPIEQKHYLEEKGEFDGIEKHPLS